GAGRPARGRRGRRRRRRAGPDAVPGRLDRSPRAVAGRAARPRTGAAPRGRGARPGGGGGRAGPEEAQAGPRRHRGHGRRRGADRRRVLGRPAAGDDDGAVRGRGDERDRRRVELRHPRRHGRRLLRRRLLPGLHRRRRAAVPLQLRRHRHHRGARAGRHDRGAARGHPRDHALGPRPLAPRVQPRGVPRRPGRVRRRLVERQL
ncbi:MAG: hypothetical protein AVDCRST_MAG66-253, partial [uncultured Pseudonocardia sp.]